MKDNQSDNDFTELGRYSDIKHAQLIKSVLESENITALVPDVHTSSILSHVMLNSSGGVRVMVLKKDLARARELINDLESTPFEFPIDTTNPEPHESAYKKPYIKRFTEATVLSLFIPVIANLWAFYCLFQTIKESPRSLLEPKAQLAILTLILTSTVWGGMVYIYLN
jgi:hypothetical protein